MTDTDDHSPDSGLNRYRQARSLRSTDTTITTNPMLRWWDYTGGWSSSIRIPPSYSTGPIAHFGIPAARKPVMAFSNIHSIGSGCGIMRDIELSLDRTGTVAVVTGICLISLPSHKRSSTC